MNWESSNANIEIPLTRLYLPYILRVPGLIRDPGGHTSCDTMMSSTTVGGCALGSPLGDEGLQGGRLASQ